LGGTSRDVSSLERTKDKPSDTPRADSYDTRVNYPTFHFFFSYYNFMFIIFQLVGQMVGGIKDIEVESSEEEEDEDEEIEVQVARSKANKSGAMFSLFKCVLISMI
jgi:signal recognition particle receptor subunit alpha